MIGARRRPRATMTPIRRCDMPNIGPLEIVVVLVIVLVDLRPEAAARAGRSLGKGMREFKDSVTGNDKDERASSSRPESRSAEPVRVDEPSSRPAEQQS